MQWLFTNLLRYLKITISLVNRWSEIFWVLPKCSKYIRFWYLSHWWATKHRGVCANAGISQRIHHLHTKSMDIIRIHYDCEGRIEKSVIRIAVWHHEACRVMKNGDPEGQIFLSYPHTNNGFFFLLTTIYFNISSQKPLNTLRCKFTRWCYLTSWVR